jgi:hypothetical protein
LLLGHGDLSGKKGTKPVFGFIAALAPIVFAAGMMVLVSALSFRVALALTPRRAGAVIPDGIMSGYYARTELIPPSITAAFLLALLIGGFLLARRVDINKFSLYMMYRNRLTRAFLGAHNKGRTPHPFTGFDEHDDILLSKLLANPAGQMQRPFHIVNTTLNMVSGTELAWQTRRASGFAFTPAFVGFELPAMPTPSGRTAHGRLRHRRQHARRRRWRHQAGHGDGRVGRGGQSQHGLPLGAGPVVLADAVQRAARTLVRQSVVD